MRVLHVMASCARVSGVAQAIMNYYRELHREAIFDFLLFWDLEKSFKSEIEQYGGKVFITGKPNLPTLIQYIRDVHTFFREHASEYDAIQLHELYLNPIVLAAAKKYGIRTRIVHSHATALSERRLSAIRNRILYIPIHRYATNYFACSEAAGKAAFGKAVVQEGKLIVVKNAICVDNFSFSLSARTKIREQLGVKNELVIGHIGRFCPQKNHFFLLDVFFELKKRNRDAKLLLVGDGEFFDPVRKKALQLGIEEAVFQVGQRTDIADLLSAMDVFLLPSVYEGLGIVLVEAQSNGLPCVASDVVPVEAEILPTYQSINLQADKKIWARALESSGGRSVDSLQAVKRAGYDIHTQSVKLLQLYTAITGERCRSGN